MPGPAFPLPKHGPCIKAINHSKAFSLALRLPAFSKGFSLHQPHPLRLPVAARIPGYLSTRTWCII